VSVLGSPGSFFQTFKLHHLVNGKGCLQNGVNHIKNGEIRHVIQPYKDNPEKGHKLER
jgi:hypothetical protein